MNCHIVFQADNQHRYLFHEKDILKFQAHSNSMTFWTHGTRFRDYEFHIFQIDDLYSKFLVPFEIFPQDFQAGNSEATSQFDYH